MNAATFTVSECLDALLAEVVRADTAAQLLQDRGWAEVARGAELTEGLDHLVSLGVREVVLEAWLRPPSRLSRCLFFLHKLFGGSPATLPFQFASRRSESTSLRVELRLKRNPGGGWKSTVTPCDQKAAANPARLPRTAV